MECVRTWLLLCRRTYHTALRYASYIQCNGTRYLLAFPFYSGFEVMGRHWKSEKNEYYFVSKQLDERWCWYYYFMRKDDMVATNWNYITTFEDKFYYSTISLNYFLPATIIDLCTHRQWDVCFLLPFIKSINEINDRKVILNFGFEAQVIA